MIDELKKSSQFNGNAPAMCKTNLNDTSDSGNLALADPEWGGGGGRGSVPH